MRSKPSQCVEIEGDLLATATGETVPGAARRVEHHIGRCAPCRLEFERYRAIDGFVGDLRSVAPPGSDIVLARQHLESRLADLRSRLVMYGVFPSPLGRILIACSEHGVSLVEYLGSRGLEGSRLSRTPGVEVEKGDGEVEGLYRELMEYLEGNRTHLQWPLDLRLVRSEFHRAVLQAASKIPYGAVVSYTGVAWNVGKPAAVRAVAQALRWNPLPIVVPCHRVVGVSGSLTGYAGNRTDLKQKLLATEGVPTLKTGREFQVARQAMYILTPDGREYCLPTCPSASPLTVARATLLSSRDRAEALGLAPCTTCRPDVHPLSR